MHTSPSHQGSLRDVDTIISDLHEAESIYNAEVIDQPPDEREGLPPRHVYSPYHLSILLILAPASILGVLARLGLVALTSFPGQSVYSLLYVQGVGCFVMGIGLKLKGPLGD